MASFTEALRAAIAESGLSFHRIGEESGVHVSVVHRFARGERDFTLDTADRLAEYFRLEVIHPTPARQPKKQRPR